MAKKLIKLKYCRTCGSTSHILHVTKKPPVKSRRPIPKPRKPIPKPIGIKRRRCSKCGSRMHTAKFHLKPKLPRLPLRKKCPICGQRGHGGKFHYNRRPPQKRPKRVLKY